MDPYGRFQRGTNGLPQLVTGPVWCRPNLTTPVDVPNNARRMGHAFLVDIAHTAGAGQQQRRAPGEPDGRPRHRRRATLRGAGEYDDELFDAHFVAGDGRVNENIGLTTVHHIFHSEHNRLAGDETVEGSIKNVLMLPNPAPTSRSGSRARCLER